MWKVVFSVLVAVLAVGLGSGSMTGGLKDINVDSPRVKNALNFAVLQHDRASNSMYRSVVTEVVKAQYQIVSGIKYVITAKVAESTSRKNSTDESSPNHAASETAPTSICVFTVWDRPWLNSVRLMKNECS